MHQRVQADDVGGAEDGALRAARGGAEDGVHLLDGVALLDRLIQRAHEGERSDAVGDEVGRVLGPHQALAQEVPAEVFHPLQRLGRGVGAGDDLHQAQIAGRVEEVGDAEPLAEVGAATGHQIGDAQPRRVRADDRVAAQLVQAGVQLLLDGQVLDDRLDDDVALGGGRGQVVLQVAGGDQAVKALRKEGRRPGLARAVQTSVGDLVAGPFAVRRCAGGGVLGDNVQKPHPQAGVGHVGGDGSSHDTGAKHGDLSDRGAMTCHAKTITEKCSACSALGRAWRAWTPGRFQA